MRNERVVIAVAGSMMVVNWKGAGKITPCPSRYLPGDHGTDPEPVRHAGDSRRLAEGARRVWLNPSSAKPVTRRLHERDKDALVGHQDGETGGNNAQTPRPRKTLE